MKRDREDEKYKKEDNIEEEQMLDTLSWALNFMRNYEEKRESLLRRLEFNRKYLFR